MHRIVFLILTVALLTFSVFGQPIVKQSEKALRANAIELPAPFYERLAWTARQAGWVVVEIVVDEQGFVINAVPSGPALLCRSAKMAAENSRFKPTLINGVPQKVWGKLTYWFSIKDSKLAPEPEVYSSPDKSFSVVFPSDLKSVKNVSISPDNANVINRELESETRSLLANLTILEKVDKGRSYEVWYMDVKDPEKGTAPVDAQLRRFIDLFGRKWGKQTSEKAIEMRVSIKECPEREAYFDLPNFRFLRAQFHLCGSRLYILAVTSERSTQLRFSEVEAYFRSFRPAP